MNSGYCGFSMSIRAVQAYEYGAKPRSKWTKADIIAEAIIDSDWTEADLKKYPVEVLRMAFLKYDSWHHTSSCFNSTDFYTVDSSTSKEVLESIATEYNKPAKAAEITLAKVNYGEWTGTRRHLKLVYHDAYAVIKGNWAWLDTGEKKKVDGKHFVITETYTKAPKGTATIFKQIKKGVK